jgi:hypothetical protein
MNKIAILKDFMSAGQLDTMVTLSRESEEAEYFDDKIDEFAKRVSEMPKTYETDGQGDDALVVLHYFYGSWDWYITEKDMENEQHQAFGLTAGDFTELGYISIKELIANGVELDIHWTPKKLGIVKKAL